MQQSRIWVIGISLLAGSALLAAPDVYQQSTSTQAASNAYETDKSIVFPVDAKHGMVVSEQRLASKVGLDILKKGGNAVDAAVATAFALAVVLPNSGNIGGGGFILNYHQCDGKVRAIDFRETAPKAAAKEIFLHQDGSVIDGRSVDQPYASGIPGTVAGLEYVWKQSGHLPWASLIEPAIQLAEKGVPVTQHLADNLRSNAQRLSRWPSSQAIFFKNGKPLKKGDLLIQKDLANSLRLIAKEGSNAFYKGAIADKIDAFMRPYHWINKDDLAHYQVVQRQPIYGDYRGYKIVMMPPPSSGGVHIIQILNILSHWDLAKMGQNSAQEIHYFAEAAKRAYADREKYLGDPDFVTVPVRGLISKHYADILAAKIGPKMTLSASIKAGYPSVYQGEKNQTTHLSVVDKDRNAVAL
ncbi:MAG: gamma-glutamyltransferase, partial [Francisella sp.]